MTLLRATERISGGRDDRAESTELTELADSLACATSDGAKRGEEVEKGSPRAVSWSRRERKDLIR